MGQNLGANVTCGKWTARLVTIGAADGVSYFWSTDQTKRCTITLKVGFQNIINIDDNVWITNLLNIFQTGLDCNEIALSCSSFYAPNDDPYKCTEGSVLHTKADSTPVRE